MTDPPFVQIVSGAYPPSLGGAQIHTARLAEALVADRLATVEIVTLWRETRHDWLLGSTIRTPIFGHRSNVEGGMTVHQVGLADRPRPKDMLHAAMYYARRERAARYFANRLSFPEETPDLVHLIRLGREHLAWRAFCEARLKNIPVVLTPNHHPRWSRRKDPVWRRIYKESDHVFALTQWEKDELTALGVDPGRVTVTGIGPVLSDDPPTAVAVRDALGIPKGRLVLFLGQQLRYKRVDLVMEAFEDVARSEPDVLLVLAGPASQKTFQMRKRMTSRDRVFILGSVSLEVKTALLRDARVLLFPSEQESFGGVLIEAASTRTPYVASDIPPLREVQRMIGGGICVAPQRAQIGAALSDYLSKEKTPAAVSGLVQSRFSWSSLAACYRRCYERVLQT